jgi:protein O-GlcNAc transferase
MSGTGEADVLNALGNQALAQGRPDEALEAFARAILAEPGLAGTHVNMAAAHLAKDAAGEAERHARRAVALDPDMALAHHNLGNALFALGDAAAAAQSFARARDLDPDEEAHWSNYLFALSFADADGRRLADETRAWGARVERKLGPIARPKIVDRDPERPLRLAYYLPELEIHVTPRFLAPVLAAHDKDRFQVSVYGARADGAPPPPGLHPKGVAWIDIAKMDATALAARMRADAIDVLIHPCTFKARYRLVLAHRAAPLQIAAINLVSSTGLSATDYLFGDAALTPMEEQPLYTERLVQLPSFNVYRAPQVAPDVSSLPAKANGFITFGSLNNPVKLTDEAVAAWASVLKAVTDSRLFLKHRAFAAEEARSRMSARFAAHGVATERLTFAGFTQDTRAYLAAYHGIDIALDPLPFGGGTTTYEAIWMGVPVLTRAGSVLMGRLSASLMRSVGHPEFVVETAAEVAPRAAAMAADLERLAAMRLRLRAQAAATIFDAKRFTAALELAVRQAWRAAL